MVTTFRWLVLLGGCLTAGAFAPPVSCGPRARVVLRPTPAVGGLSWVRILPTTTMSATLPLRLATVVAAVPKLRLGALAALLLAAFAWAMKRLNTPSRVYDKEANSVGREYDAWTSEGILEYYWGEHIHLGYYAEGERRGPFYGGKDFIEAKYDFIDKMLEFSQVDAPQKVLDVGCGIGGTSRWHPHPRLSATRS